MHSGAVTWGYTLSEALKAKGPTHLFSSIDEMKIRLAAGTEV
jgi:phosphoglycolate phosphatase